MEAKQTPLEDLRRDALRHYDEASTALGHWKSDIPQAINYMYDHAELQERRRNNLKDLPKHALIFFAIIILASWIIARYIL